MLLVEEIRKLAATRIEGVDISEQMNYIRSRALEGFAIFYPAHQIGVINADENRFATKEQIQTLRQEGFNVTSHYVKQEPGYLVYETERYVGEKVSW